MYGGDEVGAIVLDIGSSTVKAGYAGEDTPKAFFPTPCGVVFPDPSEAKAAAVGSGDHEMRDAPASTSAADLAAQMMRDRRIITGGAQNAYRDAMEVMTPVQHGLIMDWDAVERIWDYTIKDRLRSDPRNHPLVMAEPYYNTQSRREKTVELAFESFQTPAFYLAKDAVMSAFAQGRATALVVSSGAGATTIVPVHDGYVLYKSALKTKIAGDSVDALVNRLIIAPKGVSDVPPQYEWTRHAVSAGHNLVSRTPLVGEATASFRAYSQQRIIQNLKESLCRCQDQAFDTEVYTRIPARPFLLPDGQVLDVGVERLIVGEAYFDPSLGLGQEVIEDLDVGFAFPGLHKMVCSSIDLCDVDIRKDLYGAIVLAGGNTLMKDVHLRLQKEINGILPFGLKVKVNVPSVTVERQFASWIGGSVLATLGTFQQMWLSKEEYEEYGSSIVLRKCA